MGFDNEEEQGDETAGTGSDELLAADTLRLPEYANVLVRLHAVRAWLTRRREEERAEFGEAAMAMARMMEEFMQESEHLRRRRDYQGEKLLQMQRAGNAQRRLQAYEDAEELLEECVDHTTTGERALVEYYLTLDTLIQELHDEPYEDEISRKARLAAFAEVQRRIERVSSISDNEE